MIPIKYTGDLTAYEEFCKRFKNRLSLILQRGYIGNRQRITVIEAKRKVATLTGNQKTLFSNNVGDRKGNWTTLQNSDMVEAPIEMLDDKSKEVLQLFRDHFDEVVPGMMRMKFSLRFLRVWYRSLKRNLRRRRRNISKQNIVEM